MNDSVLGGDAWHPLRSLTRTNGSCDKLFHSFYFVDIIDCDADNLSIALQVPSYKRSRDDVAEGLLYFAGEIARSLKQEYIDFLLAHNKTCRKFWNQWFNKSDLDFDKNFHSKNS